MKKGLIMTWLEVLTDYLIAPESWLEAPGAWLETLEAWPKFLRLGWKQEASVA